MDSDQQVTGRDGLIVGKALAYAIAAIQSLPSEKQEWSDCQDMTALMNALWPEPEMREHFAGSVERHFGHRPVFVDERAAQ